jgi:AdoMet-dependent heme synthase
MGALERIYELGARHSIPLRNTFELLEDCPCRCAHCYVTRTRERRLSLAVVVDLLDQMEEAGAFFVSLTGGEIGLRDDLFEIIREAKQRRFHLTLFTTGTLWSAREWDQIAGLGVNRVRVSLYGVTPALHDSITGTLGSHRKTVRTMKGLLARDVPIEIGCPVLARNVSEVEAVLKFCEGLGAAVVIDPLITFDDAGSATPRTAAPSRQQLIEFYSHPHIQKHFRSNTSTDSSPESRPCQVGHSGTFVRCNGDVLPCVNWPEVAGNIFNARLLDIYRASEVFQRCRNIRRSDMTTCCACNLAEHCQPCVGMHLQERGSMSQPASSWCNNASARMAVSCSSPGSAPRLTRGGKRASSHRQQVGR